MAIWRNGDGKIVRGTGCTIARCDTSPCGVTVACCPNAIPTTLTMSWSSIDSSGGPVAGPTSTTLTWSGSIWEGTLEVSGQTTLIELTCADPDWEIATYAPGPTIVDAETISSPSCDPVLFEVAVLAINGGFDLIDVAISE